MKDVTESWRTAHTFWLDYLVNERINDRNQMPSLVAQQCRQSSWKRWFLSERWESIFIMEVNKEIKSVEVAREGASSNFLLEISIQQKMNVCMVPFFPIGWRNLLMCTFAQGWWMKRFVVALGVYILELDKNAHFLICISVFNMKVILISREPDDTWVRKDGTHFFAGYSDT